MALSDLFANAFSGDNAFPATLSLIGTGIQAGGQALYGRDAATTGANQNAVAQWQAAQLRRNAGQDVAASQRDAYQIGLEGQYITSRAIANAAGSGGAATDPSVVGVISRIAGQSAYQQASALYGGTARAQALELQAEGAEQTGQLARARGKSTQTAANFGALATTMRGGASLYEKYGLPAKKSAGLGAPSDQSAMGDSGWGW
jgi:hypothetical protein